MQYRIGEFARLGGVSIKTLRFYDQIGLLRPVSVDARTQYRLYAPRQLQELATILALKELGASLEDIHRAVRNGESQRERRRLLEKLRRNAECSMAAARRSLLWIDGALDELNAGEREVPVVLKQRSAVRVASIRAQAASYEEIGLLERDLQHAVVAELAGPLKGVLWHRCAASGVIEGEPFMEISRRTPRSGAYELKELPSATVAAAYCEPTDQDAVRVYDAVDRWLHLHDYRLDGPKREIYVGQILEVQFPVKPA
ncbi:MAG TPA: MerR family transcriptional regulator [Povalibacter sp.]|nr:MerR family transcriptional regulator [Povalibacter sp.]